MPCWDADIAGADAYLAGQAAYLANQGVNVSKEVSLSDNVPTAILDSASRINADLIAIATNGVGGVSRFVFGTVADEVTRKSPTSLLVFHPKSETALTGTPKESGARALASA